MSSSLSPGTQLGRYEIRSKLGEGGMGEVYLAQDTELDRTVAIKVLAAAVVSDQQRMQRFVQEAKAASALNHPHILTIHEIGTTGPSRFLVTEFIEGDTLRQKIRGASLHLYEVLEIATQVAGALAAAHAAGIIHRDIKPENIMVRRDGYIKLLDFGLAKLTEPQTSTTDTEAPTKALVNTDAGTVMGTANYMSPEQAKGTKVDTRTDLWSLGAVVYEMVSGHVPFAGETPTETISLILQREPPPLGRYVQQVPAELERIITKTLTKDREQRYQSAKDLLIDLRNLKRKLELDAEIDRTTPPELRATGSTSGGQSQRTTASGGMQATATAGATGSASSAEYIVSGIKQHKLAAAVVVIALVAGVIGLIVYRHSSNTEVAIESIAVLPFENQNRDASVEWLSDGVTESIINNLAQLPNLRVSPRSTVFHYKGSQKDPLAVGKELGVRAVLSGRFLQTGDDVTISVELVDVRDNKQLWGDRFNHKAADALMMQQQISRQISEQLRLKLSETDQQKMMARRNTTNADAYQAYLKGRYYWNRRTGEGLKKSVEYFNQAIEKDPSYALAYTGLADAYITLPSYSATSTTDAAPKAKAAAARAIELDPNLAEAHTSLANIMMSFDADFAGSEREFKRAIELNQNYPTAHHWYALFLATLGRSDDAKREILRAQQLDPLSLIINRTVGSILFWAREYDQAIVAAKKTLEIDPNFAPPHQDLAIIYGLKGRYEEAIPEINIAIRLNGRLPQYVADLGYIHALAGNKAEAQKTLDELRVRAVTESVSPYRVAMVYAALGDKEKAFEYLEEVVEKRIDTMNSRFKVDPYWDGLRADPRFADLLRRFGLAQ